METYSMNTVWTLAAVATLVACYTAWQRRHLWRTPYATPVKAALLLGGGLILIGPLGEWWGDQMYVLTHMHNLEDFHGHFLMLASATLLTRRACRTLGWMPTYLYQTAIGCAVLIMAVGGFTKTILHASSANEPGSTAYWPLTSLILAPAFALAAYSHLVVAVEHRGARISALMHSVYALIGLIGCIMRVWPGVPVSWTYWCYLVALTGLVGVNYLTWRRIWHKPLKALHTM